MLTTDQAAHRLGIRAVTVRKAIVEGRLTAKKFGHVWVVLDDAQFRQFTPRKPGRPKKRVM